MEEQWKEFASLKKNLTENKAKLLYWYTWLIIKIRYLPHLKPQNSVLQSFLKIIWSFKEIFRMSWCKNPLALTLQTNIFCETGNSVSQGREGLLTAHCRQAWANKRPNTSCYSPICRSLNSESSLRQGIFMASTLHLVMAQRRY